MLGRLCPSTQEDSTSMSRKAQTSYLWCRGATFRLVDCAPTETPLHLEAWQGSCSIKHCCSHMAEMNTESKKVGAPSHLSWNAGNIPDFAFSWVWEVWSNHRSKSWKPRTMTKNTKKTKRNKKQDQAQSWHIRCVNPHKKLQKTLSKWGVEKCYEQKHRYAYPHPNGQRLQVPVLLCMRVGTRRSWYTVGGEMGRWGYWSQAHLWQFPSSQTNNCQSNFHIPLCVRTSRTVFIINCNTLLPECQPSR